MKTYLVSIVFLLLFILIALGCINQPGLQPNQTTQQNQTAQQNHSVQTNQTTQQNQTGIFMLPGFKRFNINETGFCGNTVCAGSETQESCCADCGCAPNQKCWNNSCIAGSQFEELNKTRYSALISDKGNFSVPMVGSVSMPRISENFVTWHQFFNKAPHIMVYSPASGKTVQLTSKSNQLSPDEYGSRIVWLEQSVMTDQNGMNIYYYDAREGIEGFVTSRASGKTAPKIDSNHIVWAEMVNNSKEIFLYDLASGKETQLTHGESIPSTYHISGNYVVWSTRDCNVKSGPCKTGYALYDIGAGKLENFTEVKGLDTYCYDFQGIDLVYGEWESEVYTNGTQPVSQIVMFNINSKTESELTDSRSFKSCPRISGNLIIWSDSRNNGSLYSYNLGTHKESNLVNLTPGFFQYDVFGNTVVYVDSFSTSGINLLVLGE